MIRIDKTALRWKDVLGAQGPPGTLHDRFVRWSCLGVLAWIVLEHTLPGPDGDVIMIDGTRLAARRMAASLSRGGPGRRPPDAPKAG